jgi:hypothetical protein
MRIVGIVLAICPIVAAMLAWIVLYMEKRLRARFVAATAAVATFLGFMLRDLWARITVGAALGFWQSLPQTILISIWVGGVFLLCWVIFPRSMKEMHILW